jgi:hypothetical protein
MAVSNFYDNGTGIVEISSGKKIYIDVFFFQLFIDPSEEEEHCRDFWIFPLFLVGQC